MDYLPTKTCDICHETELHDFVDGRTGYGPWATMCLYCHEDYGVGLGVGKGQQFQWRSQDGKHGYVKTAG